MKITDTGGPAFPQFRGSDMALEDDMGMTLRDWFAGMAMQGTMANPKVIIDSLPDLAAKAYEIADAMLEKRAAREKDDK